jgi:pimeloyl-ACP methyl ester carboxylesterase
VPPDGRHRKRCLQQALALALLAATALAMIVYGSWIDAQGRTIEVLSVVGEVPVLSWVTRVVTEEPREEELLIAGVPTTVVRPGGGDRWPALVFVNGATPRGRYHPDVRRLAQGLARAGFLVLVPDLPGLARGEITLQTRAAAIAVARVATERPDARGVGLLGVSVGATLALLAAEDPALSDRITIVAGTAPYTDLANAVRIATTGTSRDDGRLVPYRAKSFLALVIARSLTVALPPGPERNALLTELRRTEDDAPDPLAPFPRRASRAGPAVRPLVDLLANRDPKRFDELYEALPPGMRAGIRRLSPIHEASRLRAPVELATAPRDKYFPPSESRGIVRSAPRARLTISSSLEHAGLDLSPDNIAGLVRLDAWIVRTLRAAARP